MADRAVAQATEYEVVIGLEIHVELLTASKMFCGCSTEFGQPPNTQVCPVCLGHPGVLPVPNEKAIEFTVKTGLAIGCEIAPYSKFDRKNYFYPDMPKDYQISQYDKPLCVGGHVDVEMAVEGFPPYVRTVGITRIHLEEDTGKLIHMGESGRIHGADYSLVDFNRAGVPLMEIVTEPDIRTPEEARAFMTGLKSILEHLEVSDCNMEQGSLRCDGNVSLRPAGSTELGVKTEVKNMNSFRSLQRALAYEIERQRDLLTAGEVIEQETRHWNETTGKTSTLRTKEFAHDYRYFPDPDLVPMEVEASRIERLRASLPELPEARRKRLMESFGLSAHDAGIMTSSKAVGDFFEECVRAGADPKQVANWMMGELSFRLNEANLEIDEAAVTPRHLAQLIKLIEDGAISVKMAKEVFGEVFETGKLPQAIVEEKGLSQLSDQDEIAKIIDLVIEENPGPVAEYKGGKEAVLGFLVGQAMKLTKGRANPAVVNELLRDRLR